MNINKHSAALKIILFGASSGGLNAIKYYKNCPSYEIVAVVDNDLLKQGGHLLGFTIKPPEVILSTNYDFIIICTFAAYEVRYILKERFNVLQSSVHDLDESIRIYGPPSKFVILLRLMLRAVNFFSELYFRFVHSIRMARF